MITHRYKYTCDNCGGFTYGPEQKELLHGNIIMPILPDWLYDCGYLGTLCRE